VVTSSLDQFKVECVLQDITEEGVSSRPYALVRLCVGGYTLGTFEDATYLPSFKAGLMHLLQAPPAGAKELACLSSDRWQTAVLENDIDGRYIVSLGETFDDFLILACRVDSRLVMIWSLFEQPAFNYPGLVAGVPHRCEVLFSDAEAAIHTFLTAIATTTRNA